MILSKLNHLVMSIMTPQKILDDLNRMLFSNLWGGKTQKIKRKNVCTDYLNGGLCIVDIYKFAKSLKLGWMVIFCQSQSRHETYYHKKAVKTYTKCFMLDQSGFLFIYLGFTSLSTLYRSYHDG